MTIKINTYRGKSFGPFLKKFPEGTDIFVASWIENSVTHLEAFASFKSLQKFIEKREVKYEYNKYSES